MGDPYQLGAPAGDVPAFQVSRGVLESGGRTHHQGADLLNGRAGDPVRAAAAGLVVRTATNASNGYGGYIVLAHRTPEGDPIYTVYAHLLRGSIRVRAGDRVSAGEPMARVGQTGRASAPHLHFEVRDGTEPLERWENTPVLDPVAFVMDRLPAARVDSTWARPYLEWGENAALLTRDARAEQTLTLEAWWRMLANAARGPLTEAPRDAVSLRDSLVAWDLLPRAASAERPSAPADWKSLCRDLKRLQAQGLRVGPAPVPETAHRERCDEEFGEARPLRDLKGIARREGRPTVADACLLVASACGPYEPVVLKSPKRRRVRRTPKPRRGS